MKTANVGRVSVRELSENLDHTGPTRPKSRRAKPAERLGVGWSGLAGVTLAGGLLISRLKVRFLHGSPFGAGGSELPALLSLLTIQRSSRPGVGLRRPPAGAGP